METAQKVNGLLFAKMLQAGCINLQSHAQAINCLNVFPIPDGDTGDNMLLTIMGGVDAAGSGTSSLAETARRAADGMLLSARGNSGVILSQIFEGIADGLKGVEEADNQEIVKALQEGVRHSYNAVMGPAEGTMLTVFRCAAEYVSSKAAKNPEAMFRDFLHEAKRVLEKTPEMLPVLKKAGVVDSGGAGLVYILEGMLSVVDGTAVSAEIQSAVAAQSQTIDINLFTEDSVLEYGYCTELLLRLQRCKTDIDAFEVSSLTEYLKSIGDSVVAFKNGSIVKIHIHTMTPDRVLAFCQKYGEFLKIKIENMSLQHNNVYIENINVSVKPRSERKPFGVVAVASGDGIKQLFTERGTDVIVDGGQCMNPSAEDFIEAFDTVNADKIFVLPNNGNVILTAKQAAKMYKDSDVRVIESRTIGDGYAALSMLSFESGDADQIQSELTEAMDGVITAMVSKSVRDTDEVHAGEYIGFVGKDIISASGNRLDSACSTVDKLSENGFDICIVIRGKNADGAEAGHIESYITSHYPGKEVYVIDGMQDIYDYILIFE
jgi:DAK2 domain fusion protein YloV